MGDVVKIEDYRKAIERRQEEQAARKARREAARQETGDRKGKGGDQPDDEPA